MDAFVSFLIRTGQVKVRNGDPFSLTTEFTPAVIKFRGGSNYPGFAKFSGGFDYSTYRTGCVRNDKDFMADWRCWWIDLKNLSVINLSLKNHSYFHLTFLLSQSA